MDEKYKPDGRISYGVHEQLDGRRLSSRGRLQLPFRHRPERRAGADKVKNDVPGVPANLQTAELSALHIDSFTALINCSIGGRFEQISNYIVKFVFF